MGVTLAAHADYVVVNGDQVIALLPSKVPLLRLQEFKLAVTIRGANREVYVRFGPGTLRR